MVDFDGGKIIKRNLEALLYEIDNRRGIFSGFSYTGSLDIFREPAMRESGLDQSQAEAAFMARRLQQAMPLSARMSPAEENSLNVVIQDVGLWKERTGYVYHHDANSLKRETPDGTDSKVINSIVRDYFASLNLKELSSTKGGGHLTWRGSEFLEQASLRLTFDIRKKYNWRMRFSVGIFSKDGVQLCNVSDWEVFGKLIYAVVELNFDCDFEYCDTSINSFAKLRNYLCIVGSILDEIRRWQL